MQAGKAVNLGKTLKRLRRDLTANPKKAALLGLMVLVACYFWAPLLLGGFGFGGKRKSTASADELILTDDPVDVTQPVRSTKKSLRWDRVQQWIAADPLMVSAAADSRWRDPFAEFKTPPKPEESKPPETTDTPPVAELPETTPGAAGLTLQSVLVGSQRKVAMINGRMYRVGDTVPKREADKPAGVEFRIARILAEGAELERGGKTYLLAFDKVTLNDDGEIVRTRTDKDNESDK